MPRATHLDHRSTFKITIFKKSMSDFQQVLAQSTKAISKIVSNRPHHWVGDGFYVQGMLDYNNLGRQLNPFIMMDYAAPKHFDPHYKQRGVGFHPHRGFETVTFAYEGEVSHRDSTGRSGTIKTGDVQWMTAGAGIQHEEMHSKEFTSKGGDFEMIQLWVNLPKAKKNVPATYQSITRESIPDVSLPTGGNLRVVAGEYQGAKGPANTHTPMNVYDISLKPNESVNIDLPDGWNTGILVRKNTVKVNDREIKPASLVAFDRTGTSVQLTAGANGSEMLLFSGEPIDEPMVGYGPFVMNTPEEISTAFIDYQEGKYGGPPM